MNRIVPQRPWRLAAAMGLLTALLLGFGFVELYRQQCQAAEWVEHTLEVLKAAATLDADLATVTGEGRGFLVDRTPDSRARFEAAAARAGADLAALVRLTADNPVQQAALDRLQRLAAARTATLRAIMDQVEKGDGEGALASVRTQRGRAQADEAAVVSRGIKAEERRLLVEREQAAAGATRRLVAGLVACGALGVGSMALSLAGTLRRRRRERDYLRQVEELNAELERRVAARTAELSERNAALTAEMARREGAEAQLRDAQRMEVIGHMAAGVAHDFNNAFQAIVSGVELVLDEVAPGSGAHEGAGIAFRSAQRGARLTHHLLAYARRQMLCPRPVPLAPLLAEFQGLLARTLDPGITMEVRAEAAAAGLGVLVDPGQLRTALLNLATNAAQAMAGGGTLTLGVRAVGDGDARRACVAISDTGTGMDADTLARCVEPFFTTHGLGGSGLGLSMAQGFAEQSGGVLHIASRPGLGTIVELRLPLAGAAPSAVASKARHAA